MAASPSARASQLRRAIAQHESAAKRDRAAAARTKRPADRAGLLRSAKAHDTRAKELRVELAKLVGSRAPSTDVAEANRQRRIEALRAGITRHNVLARQARTVGNRSVELKHLAEAKRLADELALLEKRDRPPVTRSKIVPAPTFTPEPPPAHIRSSPSKLARLRRVEKEIQIALQNAASYREKARRAIAIGNAALAAKHMEDARIMEARARAWMEARRKLIYVQGRGLPRPESRVGTSAVREAPGPGDRPLISQPAMPTITAPGAPPAISRPGFRPPRPDTESFVRPRDQAPEDGGEDASTDTSTDTSTDASTGVTEAGVAGGGGMNWWIIASLLGLAALGYAAYEKKKGGSGGGSHRATGSFSFHKPASSTTSGGSSTASSAPRSNPRKRRKANRRRGARRAA